MRRGRKIDTERKFFPGYVLVKCDLSDEVFHLIKNTPKVTGFLGAGDKPMPISEAEAGLILHQVQEGIERPKPSVSFEARLPRSTATSRKSTTPVRASRSRSRSSDVLPRWNWNSDRSKRSNWAFLLDREPPGLQNPAVNGRRDLIWPRLSSRDFVSRRSWKVRRLPTANNPHHEP